MSIVMRFVIVGFIGIIMSCSKDDEVVPDGPDCTGITWSATISPIISTSCAISGCHIPGGSGTGNFLDPSTVQAAAQSIKTQTANRTMPQVGSLTNLQIEQIACWVDEGALVD